MFLIFVNFEDIILKILLTVLSSTSSNLLLAERLLKELIRDYDKHYHAENLSYNIHILLHLVDFCR